MLSALPNTTLGSIIKQYSLVLVTGADVLKRERERERDFIRIKQATKRDMPIKPEATRLCGL